MNTTLITVGVVLFALFAVGVGARVLAAIERCRAPLALHAGLVALAGSRLDDVRRLLPFTFSIPIDGRYEAAGAATAAGALDLFERWVAALRLEGGELITEDLRDALERAARRDAAVPGALSRRFKRLLWALAAKGAVPSVLIAAASEEAAQEEGQYWEDEDGEVRMAQRVLPAGR